MLYLKNTQDAQSLYIPRDGCLESGSMTLTLKNTISKVSTEYSVSDLRISDLYYNVAISLDDDFEEGEHEYKLIKGEVVLSEGLCLIGDYDPVEELNNIIEYEQ